MALDPDHWRKHAEHARRLAKLTSDPKLKRAYETIAREFESLLSDVAADAPPPC